MKTLQELLSLPKTPSRDHAISAIIRKQYSDIINTYADVRRAELAVYTNKKLRRRGYLKNKQKIKEVQKIKRQTMRNDPFHSDLQAILDHFQPNPITGSIQTKTYLNTCGYIFSQYKSKPYYVHRLVWMSAHGFIDPTKEINHIDGNKLNCKLDNLEIVSSLENMAHAFRTGLRSKMTDEERREKWNANNKAKREKKKLFDAVRSLDKEIDRMKKNTASRIKRLRAVK